MGGKVLGGDAVEGEAEGAGRSSSGEFCEAFWAGAGVLERGPAAKGAL